MAYNKGYINHFSKIIFTQPLVNGRYVRQVFTKLPMNRTPNREWEISYENFTEYEFCKYRGIFGGCADCWRGFGEPPESFCRNFIEVIDGIELAARCEEIEASNLPPIEFYVDEDGE